MEKSREEDVLKAISRCSKIINGLENYEPFLLLIDDFHRSVDMADGSWHKLRADQASELSDLRVAKLAGEAIINVLETYKHDLQKYQEELAAIRHPDIVQGGYYDNE